MKRNQSIILALIVIALVQLACSMPGPQAGGVTPTAIIPTTGSVVITATTAPTQQVPPTQPVVTATTPPTATTAPTSGSSTGSCSFLVTFVADVTIPDDTRIAPGASFTKTWRVRNDGTCTWGPDKALHAMTFTGGSRLSAVDQVSLPASVAPGQSIDLSVNMTAPAAAGVYTSEWKFRVDGVSGLGPYIGLGPGRVAPLFTRIVVGATPTPTATSAAPAPTRIEFVAGATGATVEGSVKAKAVRSYVVWAAKGQLLMAGFSAPVSDMRLQIVEAATGTVIVAVDGSSTQAILPANGDYLIQVIGGSADANFTLGVTIPSRISFASGATSATVDGKITNRQPVIYLLRAQAGQTMTVKIVSPSSTVVMTIYGLDDGQPLVRSDFGLSEWSGALNVTQDYVIMAVPSVDNTTFTMTVTVK